MRTTPTFAWMLMIVWALAAGASGGVWVRVKPVDAPAGDYVVHVATRPNYSENEHFIVGQPISNSAKGTYYVPQDSEMDPLRKSVKPLAPTEATQWIDLTGKLKEGSLATVSLYFEPKESFPKGVKAQFDIATAADDAAIVRSITDHDPGNVISLRVPFDLAKDKQWLLSIREDAQRRLDQIRGFKLPAGPLPKKIWCMTGFRPWGMYTDPEITKLDFQVIKEMGLNGFWDFTADTWKLAEPMGIDRTTLFWRSVGSPVGFLQPDGITMDWAKLTTWFEQAYAADVKSSRAHFPDGKLPMAVVDMMDEPAGVTFGGPEVTKEFRVYLQGQGLAPEFFGKKSWDEVEPMKMDTKRYFWWDFFTTRQDLNTSDLITRRTFYWNVRFWCWANAELYALATNAVEKFAPEVVGTRVNLGPPWWYDYGTIPRGIDQVELGEQRGITVAFNEDWIGNGGPRWPLETNVLLAAWCQMPFQAAGKSAPLGGFLTRDANRTAAKLRAFGFLARGVTIFDFYYYGPSYGHFDHWSDNASMVQGVAELTRDIGAADDILAAGKPPTPKVALLYSRSWPVWKQDDTEQIEWMMVYLALIHSHVPVDIVSGEQVADGRFAKAGYSTLYVVNESIPQKAATAVEQWVTAGGHLWASGWAGAHDEYDTPTDAWNGLLGVRERSWKPAGDLKRLGELIGYADHLRPYFSRRVEMMLEDGSTPLDFTSIVVPEGATPAKAYRRAHGKGVVQVVPWTAGKDYIDGHKVENGPVAEGAILYPSDARREVIGRFAVETAPPPATTNVSQIPAWPLWSQDAGVVLLANYTGKAADAVTVKFSSPRAVASVRSLRKGELKIDVNEGDPVTCILPVQDVTDMLMITFR